MRISAPAAAALARSSGGSKRKSLGSTRRESDLQAEILRAVNLLPGVVMWKSGAGAFRMTHKGKTRYVKMGRKGVSDLIGWKRTVAMDETGHGNYVTRQWARFVAMELKRPHEHATVYQQAFLDLVKQDGGIAACVHSVEEAIEVLR